MGRVNCIQRSESFRVHQFADKWNSFYVSFCNFGPRNNKLEVCQFILFRSTLLWLYQQLVRGKEDVTGVSSLNGMNWITKKVWGDSPLSVNSFLTQCWNAFDDSQQARNWHRTSRSRPVSEWAYHIMLRIFIDISRVSMWNQKHQFCYPKTSRTLLPSSEKPAEPRN